MSFLDLINQEQPTKQPKQTTYAKTKTNEPPIKPTIKRTYKTTTLTPAKKVFSEVYARTDNATKAIEVAYPNQYSKEVARVKGHRLLTNDNVINHIEYQKNKLEKLATKAVKKVEQLIDSDNEQIATANVWKTIEQVQGKATIKSTSVNYNFTEHISDKESKYGKYEG